MKTATVKQIKDELKYKSQEDLLSLCLHLAKFKKENKELLTYLLFEAHDEAAFITAVKEEINQLFSEINTNSYYYIKKSVRKILKLLKKYIRYSKNKETEVELLLYFCFKLKELQPPFTNNVSLVNIFERQVVAIKKSLKKLHTDLQHDYRMELQRLQE